MSSKSVMIMYIKWYLTSIQTDGSHSIDNTLKNANGIYALSG